MLIEDIKVKMRINRMSIFACLLISLIFSASPLSGQDVRNLTLQQAIEIASTRSPDALVAKHRFRSSYWQFRSYKASYLPSVELGATLPEFNRSIQRVSLAEGEALLERQYSEYSLNAFIRQKIGLTGGQFFIRSGLDRLDNFTDSTTVTQYLSTPINVGYSQPLFKYNAYKWEKQLEPMKYQEAKKRYLEDMEQVAITATNHFFNLLLSQIREKIALINMANYDTMYKIAQGRFNLGKIAENELLQLELQYLRSSASVEEAAIDVENKLFRLKSYLRIQDDLPIVLIPPSNIDRLKIDFTLALEQARENRSDALAFERRLLEAEEQVNIAKMDGRFDADLYAVYGLTQTSNNFDYVYDTPLDQQQLTLGISVPILDWGVSKGKIKMAESNQELVQTTIEQERIDFDQEIFLQTARFNMQYNQVLIAAKADTVAAKSYEISKARYLIGKISITDLNIAQAEADNSKSNYINSLWTYWSNFYQMRKLTLYDFENNREIVIDFINLL